MSVVSSPAQNKALPDALASLLDHPDLWRGRGRESRQHYPATGFKALDQRLPGGGWPQGALSEIICDHNGIGELSLLLPALTRLSQEQQSGQHGNKRWIAFIAPPYLPYAPAFTAQGIDLNQVLLVFPPDAATGSQARSQPNSQPNKQLNKQLNKQPGSETCWAIEQALRSGTCAAVLAWPKQISERTLRRLQLAAEEGSSWGVLFRTGASARDASPAALRLHIKPEQEASSVEVFKCRGGRAFGPVQMNFFGDNAGVSSPGLSPGPSPGNSPGEPFTDPSDPVGRLLKTSHSSA